MSISIKEAIENKNLWFVHSIDSLYQFNGTGQSVPIESLSKYGTESYFDFTEMFIRGNTSVPSKIELHHFINGLVLPFSDNDIWDCYKYVFVAPMKEFIGELYMGKSFDYATLQPHKYSRESFLLVPNDEVDKIKRDFPGLLSNVKGYNYPQLLSDESGNPNRGKECFNALRTLEDNGDYETPRMAVEKLFDELEEKLHVKIWRLKEEDIFEKEKINVPRVINESKPPKRINNNSGKEYDIDKMLIKIGNKETGKPSEGDFRKIIKRINELRSTLKIGNDGSLGKKLKDKINQTTDAIQENCNEFYEIPTQLSLETFRLIKSIKHNLVSYFGDNNKSLFRFSNFHKRIIYNTIDTAAYLLLIYEILNNYKRMYPTTTSFIDLLTRFNSLSVNKTERFIYKLKTSRVVNGRRGLYYFFNNIYERYSKFCIDWDEPAQEDHSINNSAVTEYITRLDELTEEFNTLISTTIPATTIPAMTMPGDTNTTHLSSSIGGRLIKNRNFKSKKFYISQKNKRKSRKHRRTRKHR
jgi:hypothetical protein